MRTKFAPFRQRVDGIRVTYRGRAARGAGLALLAGVVATPVLGQTASQITPPSFSPPLQRQGGAIAIPEGQGLEAPPGADRLSVRVRRLDVQGDLPALAGATAEVEARLSGRTVTAAAIFEAARALEQAYAAAGFALVRVVVPAQQLRDGGDVRLLVVDGVIERIDVSALPPEIRDRIADILSPLIGTRGLTLALLERKLLLAGDTPGTALRSTLAPGGAPGASVLVVEARYKAVTGFTGIDNVLASSLGRYTASLGLDLNSPTGSGEVLYFRTFGLPTTGGNAAFLGDEPRNRALAVGLILPLGTDGLTLNLETTNTRTTPRALPGTIGFASEFSRYSARLRYPLVRSRDLTLNTEVAFDAQEERVAVRVPVEAPFSLDRLRVARGATDFLWFLPTDGVLTGRLAGSFGIDGLGARPVPPLGSQVPSLSRAGARPEFQKLEAALTFTQPLAEHMTLDLRARAQTSFNQALTRAEQIGLASLSGLSTFDAGLLQGDEGFVTRGEVQFPFVVPVVLPFGLPSIPAQLGSGLPPADVTPGAFVLSPYGFGAFGLVRQQLPTALERPMVRGVSYGAGLRIAAAPGFSFTNAAVTVEYGRAERSDRLPADNRLTFSVALQF